MFNKNAAAIFSAILLGLMINQGSSLAFLIKYFLMIMLFFPFLSVSLPKDKRVYQHIFLIFSTMLGFAMLLYLTLKGWNSDVATAAFLVAFTPTATASPVIIGLLKKNLDFVVASVVITNILVACCLPFVLPVLLPGVQQATAVVDILYATMTVVLVPMAAALLVNWVAPDAASRLARLNSLVFAIWLILLYLASSKASSYLLNYAGSVAVSLPIALITLLICGFNFTIGKLIGGTDYPLEASQALGQKNTLFMTWVALEYFDSIVVIGPVIYIVYQNIYNSWLLHRMRPTM